MTKLYLTIGVRLAVHLAWLTAVFQAPTASAARDSLGLFSDHTDIGEVKHPGRVVFDPEHQTYTVSGSGANMWFKQDAFHYVWKKVTGDVALSAAIAFVGRSAEPHRKACLLIRQTLDADSPYADVAVHGDGLTSLQFRDQKGGVTKEVQTSISGPSRLRIDKIGDMIYMSLATGDNALHPSGCSVRLPFGESFYIGIGVCAHQADVVETAVFSEVTLSPPSRDVTAVRSSLETVVIASTDRRSVYHTTELIEAPNWTRDGRAVIFNSAGRLYRCELSGATKPQLIDTGAAINCTSDHGISADGTQLVFTDATKSRQPRIFTAPIAGGPSVEITSMPSSGYAWSPDGTHIAYSAERDGQRGIFVVPSRGGPEIRLTTATGVEASPDYSADGKFIYFHSDRSGRMQIWRMTFEGKNVEQVTKDEKYSNAYAHPSPNGRWIAVLSYDPDIDHIPRDRDVVLRLLNLATGEIAVLANLYGGEGTINAPSWSPDSTKLAYVRYQPSE